MSTTPALRAIGCSACRFSTLRLFAADLAPLRAQRLALRSTPFNATGFRFSTFRPTAPALKGFALEENAEKHDAEKPDEPSFSESESAPWYLEVEPPTHPTLLHEPPPLPDIPEGSPKLVEPLIKFVSDDLGLDDLTLMDLREIDPPPALGPDLMMLFGTARSERHLHVSADRLVRWLRGRGISAKADGLLGRNELKTKLRRAARKAKMLGTTGVARGGDDGISTGWICVNLGTVGSSEEEVLVTDATGAPTGFGMPHMGTTIVVQVMVGSRRRELDLEKLWADKLRRSLEKKGISPKEDQDSEQTQDQDAFSDAFAQIPVSDKNSWNKSDHSLPTGRRFYSLLTRQVPRPTSTKAASTDVPPKVQEPEAYKFDSPLVQRDLPELLSRDVEFKTAFLDQLISHIESLPVEETYQQLQLDSPFLSLFDRALEHLPPGQTLKYRVRLQRIANEVGATGTKLEPLVSAFREMQSQGHAFTRAEYLNVISATLTFQELDSASLRQHYSFVLEVLESMHTRGEKVLAQDVVVSVLEPLVRRASEVAEVKRVITQFEELFFNMALPCPSEDAVLRLLDAYAWVRNWDKFWEVWRVRPRYGRARSDKMYEYLFKRFAKTRQPRLVVNALRWCVDEMWNEQPPVIPKGQSLRAIEDCIRIVEPGVERMVDKVTASSLAEEDLRAREFVKLWLELHPH